MRFSPCRADINLNEKHNWQLSSFNYVTPVFIHFHTFAFLCWVFMHTVLVLSTFVLMYLRLSLSNLGRTLVGLIYNLSNLQFEAQKVHLIMNSFR